MMLKSESEHGNEHEPVKNTNNPPVNKNVIIKAENVVKTYEIGEVPVHALRGLTLEISRGEMLAVMGPSGCGKTTLLNCLSGIDDIDKGRILIEDQDLAKLTDDQRTRYRASKMGFIFQSYNLLPILTALENVELPLLVVGVPVEAASKKAMEALELVGLADRAEHKPSQLSGGQQQRVAVARSLVNEPLIVWADEPTGNLDKENSGQIMEILQKLNRENGQTFVIVTHDPEVAKVANRIVKMENGVIVSR
jgi:putative ABC transport system ATP-binding protein